MTAREGPRGGLGRAAGRADKHGTSVQGAADCPRCEALEEVIQRRAVAEGIRRLRLYDLERGTA